MSPTIRPSSVSFVVASCSDKLSTLGTLVSGTVTILLTYQATPSIASSRITVRLIHRAALPFPDPFFCGFPSSEPWESLESLDPEAAALL
ncbi:hypothetical protein D3C76_1563620 [compost metagenome]